MTFPWRKLVPLAGLVTFGAALVVLHRVLAAYHFRELWHDLRAISVLSLIAAMALTALDYWALTAYDALSLTAIGGRLAYRKVAATAFIAFACSHNLGYALISGGAIRWRWYTIWGLSNPEIAGITILGGISYIFGFLFVGALTTLAWPPAEAANWLGHGETRAIGAGVLLALVVVIAAFLARRRPWQLRDWTLPAPQVRPTVLLLIIGCLDWVLDGCTIWVLLPNLGDLTFVHFLACYMVAFAAGNLSQVPGGLGVIEAALLMMLTGRASVPALAGALLAFRAIYFLLPFILALSLLGVLELVRHAKNRGQRLVGLPEQPKPSAPT